MNVKRENQHLIICPDTKQFTDLVVCAANCGHKCSKYRSFITYEMLLDYVEKHPEYMIIGEIMPTQKTSPKDVNKYWIVSKDNTLQEVSEDEIMKNPQNYLDKQIWQKPPYRFEIIVTLRRIKAD
ncbi:MAG: hypothetical protein JXB60_00260 [Candidatus Cloacimonetes bacterium]|nr:hypothetical protein [Candidatus Cloacimonadota bacterium]